MRLAKDEFHADHGSTARAYGTPKELWGFRVRVPRGDPVAIAGAFARANADWLGIEEVLPRLRRRAVLHGLGATHVILQQHHAGVAVHRGFVTVHIARQGEVYLVKSRAVPLAHLPADTEFRLTAAEARRRALRWFAAQHEPAAATRASGMVRRWFYHRGRQRPAWRVRVHRFGPREEWIVYVDARTARILSEYDNLALGRGKATVFDPNPIRAARRWRALYDPATGEVRSPPRKSLVTRTLHGLESARGYLDGERVSTALTAERVRRADRDYRAAWRGEGFHEAMAYYHVDAALRYLQSLGYTGERALFRSPIEIDVHWSDEDNSHFDPVSRTLQFGTGGIPDSEDGEVILHELGHAVQDAICPDFGLSHEAAAMGEGFGDYFAASFFARKKLASYRDLVMSWAGLPWHEAWLGEPRPFLRRLNEAWTFADFEDRVGLEHDNGTIWSAVLWDLWKAIGVPRVADRLVLDSHFQLEGYTKMVRGARALLDADRNLYGGRHGRELRAVFAARGLAPVQ